MIVHHLTKIVLLALLSGSLSATETPPYDDAAGSPLSMEKVIETSPPPDTGAFSSSSDLSNGDDSNSSTWSTGKFILKRSQVIVPSGEAQAYWYCSGGQDRINNRLMLFEPNVTFDEIGIDTSTWQDPIVDDWNATINVNATDNVDLMSFSIGGGSGCGCGWFQLNFGEWLRSKSEVGSSIATDHYLAPNIAPINWYFPGVFDRIKPYLPSDYDPWMIKQVYTGEPLSSVSSGWQPPTTLEGTSPIRTTNRYLRIENTGGPVTLRAMSSSPQAYGIVVYLIKENPDPNEQWDRIPNDQWDNGPINPMELFTDGVSELTEATAMTFASIPQGYYYAIFIMNNFEETTQWSNEPPYPCTMGPNGLSTQYDVTYSLQTCAEAACNAETIVVVDSPPVDSPPSGCMGTRKSIVTLFTILSMACALL